MKILSETVTYACHSVLRLRDRRDYIEVARAIEVGVGQEAQSKKGSALNLRNLFFKKLGFLLCNVATLRKNEISALCNVVTLETHI